MNPLEKAFPLGSRAAFPFYIDDNKYEVRMGTVIWLHPAGLFVRAEFDLNGAKVRQSFLTTPDGRIR